MRIYLPTTLAGLRAAVAAGEFGPAPLAAHTVTPALREWYASGDEEELEYVATMAAALDSLRLLSQATPPDGQPRRVVVAADVPDSAVSRGGTEAASRQLGAPSHGGSSSDGVRVSLVVLGEPVRLSQVVSAHVDDPEAAGDVAAAAAALPAADVGDDDAQWLVDGLEDHELQWFARQELPSL